MAAGGVGQGVHPPPPPGSVSVPSLTCSTSLGVIRCKAWAGICDVSGCCNSDLSPRAPSSSGSQETKKTKEQLPAATTPALVYLHEKRGTLCLYKSGSRGTILPLLWQTWPGSAWLSSPALHAASSL